MRRRRQSSRPAYKDLILGDSSCVGYWRMGEPDFANLIRQMGPAGYWRLGNGYRDYVMSLGPVGYWRLGEATPGTGTAVDETGRYNGTYVASPTGGVAGSLVGDPNTAVTFNGTTQWVSAAGSAVADVGTISVWFKRAAIGTGQQTVVSLGFGSMALTIMPGNDLWLICEGYANVTRFGGAGTLADTNWHHAVITKNGADRHAYLDGADITNNGADSTMVSSVATSFGYELTSGTRYFGGTIDEPAIFDRALDPAEVYRMYQIGIGLMQPNQAVLGDHRTYRDEVMALGPVGYWRLGEASGTVAVDETGAYDGTYVGSPTLGATGVLSLDPDKAVTLSGSGQYVTVANGPSVVGGSFTLLAWVNPTSFASSVAIFGAEIGGFGLSFNASGLLFLTCTTVDDHAFSGYTATAGTTIHVAAVYDYAARTVTYYINGMATASPSTFDPAVVVGAKQYRIGSTHTGAAYPFHGQIDEPAIFDRALTAEEIARLYAVGKGSGFGVSVGGAVPGAASALTGDAGDTAMAFNGTTQHVMATGVPDIASGTVAFSASGWGRWDNYTGFQRIFSMGGFELWPNTAQMYFTRGADTAWAAWVPATGAWAMWTVTYDGANMRLYMDGTLVGGPTASTASVASGTILTIGSAWEAAHWMGGAIDEVAIFDRALSAAEVAAIYRAGVLTGVIRDSVGTNHGTPINVTPASFGAVGALGGDSDKAMRFNGKTTGAATVVGLPSLGVLATYSIGLWAKGGAFTGRGYDRLFRNGADIVTIAHDYANDRVLHYRSGGSWTVLAPFAIGELAHFLLTFDGTTTCFYKNGVRTYGGAVGVSIQAEDFNIGAASLTEGVSDTIDEVSIWNRALRADEVLALYEAGRG